MRSLAYPSDGCRATPIVSVRRYLSCLRYGEILVLQGSPLLGAAFAMGKVSPGRLGALLVFAVASVLLVAHIFALNDWAGVDADLNDANKVAGVFATKGISREAIRRLWLSLLALSLALFGLLGARPLAIALAIAALSLLYSRPASPAKCVPVLSSILHLGGGMLHFLLGYSLFSALDGRGLALALFFGLSFAAGHLHQEVRDFDSDARNGIKTNAVTFGKTPTFLAGLAVFTLAYAQLVVLAAGGILPGWLAGLALLYPLHLYWSLRVIAGGLSFEAIGRLQARYRALYAVIGAAMLAALLISPAWQRAQRSGAPAAGAIRAGPFDRYASNLHTNAYENDPHPG
jgi:4-hydroxybenzoate polyprenyltransferase